MCIDYTHILRKLGEAMCYQTQMPLIFSGIGQYCPIRIYAKKKQPRNSKIRRLIGLFYIKYGIFSKYFMSFKGLQERKKPTQF